MPPKLYRSYAAECLRWTMKAADPATRSAMRRVAIAWIDLAEQAERNQRNDTVYEAPGRERREKFTSGRSRRFDFVDTAQLSSPDELPAPPEPLVVSIRLPAKKSPAGAG
jgi:hypothetical protein